MLVELDVDLDLLVSEEKRTLCSRNDGDGLAGRQCQPVHQFPAIVDQEDGEVDMEDQAELDGISLRSQEGEGVPRHNP